MYRYTRDPRIIKRMFRKDLAQREENVNKFIEEVKTWDREKNSPEVIEEVTRFQTEALLLIERAKNYKASEIPKFYLEYQQLEDWLDERKETWCVHE